MNTIWDESDGGDTESKRFRRLQTTFIPEDFNEWYFICASFNYNVDEQIIESEIERNSFYWLNHIKLNGEYTAFSELGNKCKVEIISRSDLLRARGFRV